MKSRILINLFTDKTNFDTAFLNLKKDEIKVSFSFEDLFESINTSSIIVFSGTDSDSVFDLLNEVKRIKIYNPIVAFINDLKSEDISAINIFGKIKKLALSC
tara:strand:- start:252 stop:557 length:306 start_codon:yes stop_codon:yes gene_type:complete